MAHLVSYELVLVDVLSSLTRPGTTLALNKFLELGGQFNESEVAARKGRSMRELLRELQDAHSVVRELATAISPEQYRQTGTLPWYGMDYSLDDFIVYTFYGHKREHSAQVAAFRDLLQKSASSL